MPEVTDVGKTIGANGLWSPGGGAKTATLVIKSTSAWNQGSGLIRRLALTAASVADSHRFEAMACGDEAAGFADGAYAKDARKAALRGRGVFCRIINRPGVIAPYRRNKSGGINPRRESAGRRGGSSAP